MRSIALLVLILLATALAAQDTPGERSELATLLGSDAKGFPKALEPRTFDFPADHGPHPGYRNEWWYVTGNLDDEDGRRFGFELTIFRFALTPSLPAGTSAWRTNQVYIAHLALTDVDGGRFLVDQRYARGAVGLAGAESDPFRVWIGDWEIAARTAGAPERWRIDAAGDDFGLALELKAAKPPALNGDAGLSQKSDTPGNASYYYSITRWSTEGHVEIDGRRYAVDGLSWLDREWSSSALDDGQQGWDWFALQLDDGSDLMFYNIRRQGGAQDRNSGGTFVRPDGRVTHLDRDDVRVEVTDTWDSPRGGTYPARWTIDIDALELELDVEPVLADQELSTTVRYWEGAVDVDGDRAGRPVSGRGYVELTGYAD